MSRYTTTIVSSRLPGDAVQRQSRPGDDLGDGRRSVTWTDPHPKPCYLFALVAGDLVSVKDSFVTRSGRTSISASMSAAATRTVAPTRCGR